MGKFDDVMLCSDLDGTLLDSDKNISQKKYIIKPKQTQTYIPKFCSFFY